MCKLEYLTNLQWGKLEQQKTSQADGDLDTAFSKTGSLHGLQLTANSANCCSIVPQNDLTFSNHYFFPKIYIKDSEIIKGKQKKKSEMHKTYLSPLMWKECCFTILKKNRKN